MSTLLCAYKINEYFTNNHNFFLNSRIISHCIKRLFLLQVMRKGPEDQENLWSCKIAHCVQIGLDTIFNEFLKLYVTVKTLL